MPGFRRLYPPAARLVHFFRHRGTRYVLAWLAFLGLAGQMTSNAWHVFDKPARPDGNDGHAAIDFGGQWIMGRMLATGQARNLYERNHLRNELTRGYPRQFEAPGQETHDVDSVLTSFMGEQNPEAPRTFTSCLLPL